MEKTQARYIVITGASAGIGYAAAKAFAKRGKNLIVIARRKACLDALKEDILQRFPALDVIVKVADLSVMQNVRQLYQDLQPYEIETMLRLNVEALTILSSLYVRDYIDVPGTQLINLSSAGGYTIVPNAVTYCAAKFFVSAFTEGLARELQESHAALQAKVLAPAATKTEFGKVATDVTAYDYDKLFGTYHTSEQMAGFLLALYDSDQSVGIVDRETFAFHLRNSLFAYAGNAKNNQQ